MEQRLRSARLVLILGVSFATISGVLGAVLGAVWLLSLSGALPFTPSALVHPKLMIFGFVYVFIVSVAMVLVQRFKNVEPSSYLGLRVFSLIVMTVGVWFFTFAEPGTVAWLFSYLAALAGTSSAAFYSVWALGRPSGPLAAADPLISASMTLMPLSLALTIFAELESAHAFGRPGLLLILLLGAPAGMVMGVGIRTVHFRVDTKLRRRAWWLVTPLHTASSAAASAAALLHSESLELAASVGYLLASAVWVVSVDALRRVKSGEQYARMRERDRVRYLYFSALYRVASIWLLAGCLLSASSSVSLLLAHPLWYTLRDAYIHSIAIGFIGNMILAYAPILMPGLMSARIPYAGLTLYPAALLNAGNVLRVSWFLAGSPGTPLATIAISALYLGGIVMALRMMHSLE
ncbi:hypothetical protein HRbin02_00813 [Candidatus Calditenuaceae archaeon HR02]|nr:hypothetical protein HRbin02_00813 [Candidatus Calditenuaceae archaeon HR02]